MSLQRQNNTLSNQDSIVDTMQNRNSYLPVRKKMNNEAA